MEAPAILPRETAMDFTACPECGSVALVVDRFVIGSTDGPVEHVRVHCVQRHRFLLPAASLAGAPRRPAVPRPRSASSAQVAAWHRRDRQA